MSIDFACRSAVRLLTDNSIEIPRQVLVNACKAFKTVNYFLRVLNDDVVALYRGEISESSFVDNLADLIESQLRRAWNEGMRANGLDPEEDMQPEWEEAYQNIVSDQYAYVDQFAADIVAGARAESGFEQFQTRAAMWANRYTDTVNRAKIITAEPNQHYIFEYGDTVDHCEDKGDTVGCSTLVGIVATGAQWLAFFGTGSPQSSGKTTCGGWRCDCRVSKTNLPLTEGSVVSG